MRELRSPVAKLLLLATYALPISGCAILCPDSQVWSTVTLAPGQSIRGRVEVPEGRRACFQLYRGRPSQPVAPYRPSTPWIRDGDVFFAFVGVRASPLPDAVPGEERRLGYAHIWVEDGRERRIVIRNGSEQPVTFTWSLLGASDAIVDWDLTTAEGPESP